MSRKKVKVKLVRDAIGGVQMETVNGKLLENVFVKQAELIDGAVNRLNMEMVFLMSDEKMRNW